MERLTLDSKKWNAAGYEPYPGKVISDRLNSTYSDQLDEAYNTHGGSITRFLLTDEAKSIYVNAVAALNTYSSFHLTSCYSCISCFFIIL